MALRENVLFLAFCAYGAATAFILPHIFSHRIALLSMAASHLGARPLTFSSQNITTAIYLIGAGAAAVSAAVVSRDERSPRIVVAMLIIVTWGHILFGLADLGLSAVHQEKLLMVFRNGHYAQVDQTTSAVHRIAGIMTEPSAYAAYGSVMMAIMSELWIRGIASKATGFTALVMLVLIILSTSTTGYLTVSVYAVILLARILFVPGSTSTAKALTIGLLSLAFVEGVMGVLIFSPRTAEGAVDMLNAVVFTKAQSASGVERAMMARQGLDAFAVSGGFGVGVGSFRSSGMLTAILGSVGVIGASLFLGYLLHVIKPLRPSTYRIRVGPPRSVGAAMAWAAMVSMVASALGSASPDPGAMFAVLAGLSLGWSAPSPAPRRTVTEDTRTAYKAIAARGGSDVTA